MSHTLTIGRLRTTYLVSRRHTHPERVKAQLDDVMQTRLSAVLEARLARFARSDDPSLWFIRRLETDLALDVGTAERAALAQIWGTQLASAIGRTLLRPPDGRNVVRFDNRDAYVAQFVSDLAAGQAWDKWYYAQFDSLRSLMTGQAVREAIIRENGRASAILLHLAQRGRLERILGVLSENDAQRIYQACSAPAAAGTPARATLQHVLDRWSRAGLRHDERWTTFKNRLRLWMTTRQEFASSSALPSAIDLLLHLADLLSRLAQPGLFLQFVSRGRRADAIALARQSGATAVLASIPILETVAAGDLEWLQQAAAVVAPAATKLRAGGAGYAAGRRMLTQCGGLYLLLPTLLDLGLHHLLAAQRSAHADADVIAVWRYWLALKCLGQAQRTLHGRDPGLLLAVGLDAQPDAETLARAVAAATRARMRTLRQGLVHTLLHQKRADGRFLALERLVTDTEAPILLLRDMRYDYWLYAGADGQQQPQAALAALADLLQQPAEVVWQAGQPCPPDVADYGAKAKAAGDALDYFHLPGLPLQVDLTLTLLAQALLRTFARRLMGFAWSSPAFLYQNFLSGQGSLYFDDEGLHVQIPPAPLRLILRMAGFDDTEYKIPWLADRRITLTLQDES